MDHCVGVHRRSSRIAVALLSFLFTMLILSGEQAVVEVAAFPSNTSSTTLTNSATTLPTLSSSLSHTAGKSQTAVVGDGEQGSHTKSRTRSVAPPSWSLTPTLQSASRTHTPAAIGSSQTLPATATPVVAAGTSRTATRTALQSPATRTKTTTVQEGAGSTRTHTPTVADSSGKQSTATSTIGLKVTPGSPPPAPTSRTVSNSLGRAPTPSSSASMSILDSATPAPPPPPATSRTSTASHPAVSPLSKTTSHTVGALPSVTKAATPTPGVVPMQPSRTASSTLMAPVNPVSSPTIKGSKTMSRERSGTKTMANVAHNTPTAPQTPTETEPLTSSPTTSASISGHAKTPIPPLRTPTIVPPPTSTIAPTQTRSRTRTHSVSTSLDVPITSTETLTNDATMSESATETETLTRSLIITPPPTATRTAVATPSSSRTRSVSRSWTWSESTTETVTETITPPPTPSTSVTITPPPTETKSHTMGASATLTLSTSRTMAVTLTDLVTPTPEPTATQTIPKTPSVTKSKSIDLPVVSFVEPKNPIVWEDAIKSGTPERDRTIRMELSGAEFNMAQRAANATFFYDHVHINTTFAPTVQKRLWALWWHNSVHVSKQTLNLKFLHDEAFDMADDEAVLFTLSPQITKEGLQVMPNPIFVTIRKGVNPQTAAEEAANKNRTFDTRYRPDGPVSAIAAAISGAAGMASYSLQGYRSSIPQLLANCGEPANGETMLSFMESPIPVAIGDGDFRYYFGALVLNSVIAIICFVLHFVVAIVLSTRRAQHGGTNFVAMCAAGGFPSKSMYLLLFFGPCMYTGFALLILSYDIAAEMVSLFFLMPWFLALLLLGTMTTTGFRAAYVAVNEDESSDAASKFEQKKAREGRARRRKGTQDDEDTPDDSEFEADGAKRKKLKQSFVVTWLGARGRYHNDETKGDPYFCQRYRYFFAQYTYRFRWFLIEEMFVSLICAVSLGVSKGNHDWCFGAASLILVILALHLLLIVVWQPYIRRITNIIAFVLTALQCLGIVIGIAATAEDAKDHHSIERDTLTEAGNSISITLAVVLFFASISELLITICSKTLLHEKFRPKTRYVLSHSERYAAGASAADLATVEEGRYNKQVGFSKKSPRRRRYEDDDDYYSSDEGYSTDEELRQLQVPMMNRGGGGEAETPRSRRQHASPTRPARGYRHHDNSRRVRAPTAAHDAIAIDSDQEFYDLMDADTLPEMDAVPPQNRVRAREAQRAANRRKAAEPPKEDPVANPLGGSGRRPSRGGDDYSRQRDMWEPHDPFSSDDGEGGYGGGSVPAAQYPEPYYASSASPPRTIQQPRYFRDRDARRRDHQHQQQQSTRVSDSDSAPDGQFVDHSTGRRPLQPGIVVSERDALMNMLPPTSHDLVDANDMFGETPALPPASALTDGATVFSNGRW